VTENLLIRTFEGVEPLRQPDGAEDPADGIARVTRGDESSDQGSVACHNLDNAAASRPPPVLQRGDLPCPRLHFQIPHGFTHSGLSRWTPC
jgi:hypothetical protein